MFLKNIHQNEFNLNLLGRFLVLTSITMAGLYSVAALAFGDPLQDAPWVMKTGPGIFRIGEIQVHKHHQRITFPAKFLTASKAIEHFLVFRSCKDDKCLLTTDIDPGAFNLALMMIGLEPENWCETASLSTLLEKDYVLAVQVARRVKDRYEKSDVSDLVHGLNVTWRYRGGQVRDGKFSAQTEGIIMTLSQNSAAVIDNAAAPAEFRPASAADGFPAAGTDVIVTIRRLPLALEDRE